MDFRAFHRFADWRVSLPAAIAVPALLAVLGFAFAACGGAGTPTTTSIAIDTTSSSAVTSSTSAATSTAEVTTVSSGTTTTAAETTSTAEALSNAEILQPDGTVKAMGFIDKVWESEGLRYIRIDYAQMLSGEEAWQAAMEAGVIGPDEQLDNDYFIVNDNPKKRQFTVSADATFATSTFGAEGMDHPVTWEQFVGFWSASPPAGGEHLREMPWWIVRDGDTVLSIEEQYLP